MNQNFDSLVFKLNCIYCFNDVNETIISNCETCNISYNCNICYEAWNNKCYLNDKHISCGLCRKDLCSSGTCRLCLDLLFNNKYDDLPELISISSYENDEDDEILHYLNYDEEINNEEIINNSDNDTRLYLIWCKYQYNLLQQFLNLLEEERKKEDTVLIEKYKIINL